MKHLILDSCLENFALEVGIREWTLVSGVRSATLATPPKQDLNKNIYMEIKLDQSNDYGQKKLWIKNVLEYHYNIIVFSSWYRHITHVLILSYTYHQRNCLFFLTHFHNVAFLDDTSSVWRETFLPTGTLEPHKIMQSPTIYHNQLHIHDRWLIVLWQRESSISAILNKRTM